MLLRRYHFEKLWTAFTLQRGTWVLCSQRHLKTRIRGSGFQASVLMCIFMNYLCNFGESFSCCFLAVSLSGPGKLSVAVGISASLELLAQPRAMWPTCFLLLNMALGLCLTLVVVFYPLSRHCLLWALMLESWVFIPVWLFDIQYLLFNRKHLPLAWTLPPLLSSMVSWLPKLWPLVFLTPPA